MNLFALANVAIVILVDGVGLVNSEGDAASEVSPFLHRAAS